jgi:hypothetical protein
MTRAIVALILTALLGAEVPKDLSPKTYGGTLLELKEPRVLPVLGSRLNVKFKTAVLQDKNGEVRAGILVADTTLGVMGDNLNVTFLGGTIAAFASGYKESKPGVYQGVLAQTVSLNTYRDGNMVAATIPKGTKVQFSHHPGRYQNRTLAGRMN